MGPRSVLDLGMIMPVWENSEVQAPHVRPFLRYNPRASYAGVKPYQIWSMSSLLSVAPTTPTLLLRALGGHARMIISLWNYNLLRLVKVS